MKLKKFLLTPKLDNVYPEETLKNTKIDDAGIVLTNILLKAKVKTPNPIVNNFIEYVKVNINSILKTYHYQTYGRIFVSADSRYPLVAYMTNRRNFVINFQHELDDYAPNDVLGIVIYGLIYASTFVAKIKSKNIASIQIRLLSIMFMNLFGKKYGVFNDISSVEKAYLIFGAHVYVNFWGENFSDHIGNIMEEFNISSIEPEFLDTLKKLNLNPRNFNTIKLVKLLSDELFSGINMSTIISSLSSMSMEAMTAFETLNRNLSLYLPALISKEFGRNLSYILPEKYQYALSIQLIRYFISTASV